MRKSIYVADIKNCCLLWSNAKRAVLKQYMLKNGSFRYLDYFAEISDRHILQLLKHPAE